MTWDQWLHFLYDRIGAVHDFANARVGASWIQTEGGSAKWNPLNCTRKMPGSTNYNSVGVQNYATFEDGMTATVATLMEKGYGYELILRQLRVGGHPWKTMKAIVASSWGTGRLIYAVYAMVRVAYWTWAGKSISGS